MSEKDIINKYFSHHHADKESIVIGIGDDAAVFKPNDGAQLVVTTDTLNVKQHFYPEHPPEALGHKALAVNLSDIAAMGAIPRWACLSLSISKPDDIWLESFSRGLYKLADQYDVKVIGGDLVKGPLSITMQIIGELKSKPLLRCNCKVNDLIYVTGSLGDAAFGFHLLQENSIDIDLNDREYFLLKHNKPQPQLDAAKIIIKYSEAAIDISDGLLIDLKRMLDLSRKGAVINMDVYPLSQTLKKYIHGLSKHDEIIYGGEDYQLLFTITAENKNQLEAEFKQANIRVTNIGKVTEGDEIQLEQDGKMITLPDKFGFDHFA